jgi:hypothetical protein
MFDRASRESQGETEFAPDRRSFHRYPCVAAAELTEAITGIKVSAQTVSLSLKGCYMGTPSPFPEGTIIRVRLSDGTRVFETTADVLSVHAESGMGVMFRELGQDEHKVLETWLEELRK